MRILVISNIYPPYFIGGYELGCSNMVRALSEAGHEVRVLTSTYGVGRETVEEGVDRLLRIDFDRLPPLSRVIRKEILNQRHFHRVCAEFVPDIIFCWNMANISLSLVCIADDMCIPVSFYVFDNWLAFSGMDQWSQHCKSLSNNDRCLLHATLPKLRLLVPGEPAGLQRAIFASDYLKNMATRVGKDTGCSNVLLWGVPHTADTTWKDGTSPNAVLYLGQIVPLKGVHTVIEAIGILRRDFISTVSLTIIGDREFNPAYVRQLHDIIQRYDIVDSVRFIGKVAAENISTYLENHDILVFPSVWDEPFGISQLEAMSAGMVVVGTATGGSCEILRPEVNALVFERENPEACARQIHRLINDEELYVRIRTGGIASVREEFNFDKVVSRMEQLLRENITTYRRIPAVIAKTEVMSSCLLRNIKIFTHKLVSVGLLFLTVAWNKAIATCSRFSKKLPMGRKCVNLFIALGDDIDLLITSLFLHRYRETHPERVIVLLVRSQLLEMAQRIHDVDIVLPFPITDPDDWQAMTRGHYKWWFDARAVASLLPSSSVQSVTSLIWRGGAAAAASAAIQHAVGPSNNCCHYDRNLGFKGNMLNFFISEGPVRHKSLNSMTVMKELFGAAGVSVETTADRVKPATYDHDDIAALATFIGSSPGPLMALAPGSREALCCWPQERFLEVGNWLQNEYQASILVLGMEEDSERCHKLYDQLSGSRKHLLTGNLSLNDISIVMSQLDFVCGNHNLFLYSALLEGITAVGILGPYENDYLNLLPGKQETIRLIIPCSPCHGHCIFDKALCLECIDTERVVNAIRTKV